MDKQNHSVHSVILSVSALPAPAGIFVFLAIMGHSKA
jgi:hypothetical protein